MKPTTTGEITPAELRKLADLHLGEGLPYVKYLHGACYALSQAADVLEASQAYARKLGEQLNATIADAEQDEARVAVRELQISSLFARIEHGDETHRAWLKSALGLHFADTAREAERLLEELKLLRSLRDQVNWFAAHPNGWTADTFEGTRDALTALHEFDDKETK